MAVRSMSIATMVLLTLILRVGAPAQNLLSNPGFEGFPAGAYYGEGIYQISNWRYFSVSGAGGSLQVVSPGREGNRAVRLSRSSGAGDSGLDRDPVYVPAAGGRRYRAVVWAKADQASTIILTVAPHDSNRTWLGTQRDARFNVGSSYRRCVTEFVAPAGTAYLNYAVRIDGQGAVTVDSCELIDLSTVAPPPTVITYPDDEVVDSFKPTIAFSGPMHTAYQAIVTSGGTTVWDSGIVTSTAFACTCGTTLQQDSTYQAQVRLQTASGWTDYSPATTFTTPSAPFVKFTTVAEGDVIRASSVTVRWVAESPTGITAQRISIDGGSWITLTTSRRTRYLYSLTEGLHSVTLEVSSAQGTTRSTLKFYVQRTPMPTGTIYYYDISSTWNYDRSVLSEARMMYDIHLAVVALQGLVNRNGPRLFIKFWGEDSKWWTRLREYDNWLVNKTVVTIPSGVNGLQTLFNTFRDDYQGAVLWDSNVYATSNVASTVAGADSLIPIRYDPAPGTVYDLLVANGPVMPVQMDLVNKFTGSGTIWDTSVTSTGSKKNDAYIWARTKYLETGKSNPNYLDYNVDAYWEITYPEGGIPGHGLLSRDFAIKNKGFVFDLSIWPDERPVDDPTQTLGLDASTYRSILAAAAARASGMIHVRHCMPWPFKYTNWGNAGGTRDPVTMEWEATGLLSQYNAYSDADSYAYVDFPNASLYSQFPLPDRLTQNRRMSHAELRKLGYLSAGNTVSPINFLNFYVGDYDSAMWMSNVGCNKWDDANRGALPLSWAFNPNLIERAAAQYEYYNRTRTANDSFICGNSGAGYVNPSRLLTNRSSGLPSARDMWIKHNLRYFRQANLKMSGFLINGTAGPLGSDVDSMFEAFSGDGTFSQPCWYPQGNHVSGTMPGLLQEGDLAGTASSDAGTIRNMGLQDSTNFLNFRTILKGPTYYNDTYNAVVSGDTAVRWALVDSYTYAALAKCHMGVIPDCRATYTFDTIPDAMGAAGWASASIGIRNDGWVTWDAQGSNAVSLLAKWMQGTRVVKTQSVPIPRDVPSGEGIVLDFVLSVPGTPGQYTLNYEMSRGGIAFSSMGDYAWESTVAVSAPWLETTPSQAKAYWDGISLTVRDAVVTAGTDQLAGAFYIEDEDRVSGIKVSLQEVTDISAAEGDELSIAGRLSTEPTGERVLVEPGIISQVTGTPLDPLVMLGRNVGGGDLNVYTLGIPGCFGTHNTGLLVTVFGRVRDVDATAKRFYLDDGSIPDATGLLVDCSGLASGNSITLPGEGTLVFVTGISSRKDVDGTTVPILIPRKQADIPELAPPLQP